MEFLFRTGFEMEIVSDLRNRTFCPRKIFYVYVYRTFCLKKIFYVYVYRTFCLRKIFVCVF